MEMPDDVTTFLIVNKDTIWTTITSGVLGAAGSYIAVLLRLVAGETLTGREIWTTFFVGTIFAMVFSTIIGHFVGVPAMVSAPMGASALITGMLGMRIAKLIMTLDVSLVRKGDVK